MKRTLPALSLPPLKFRPDADAAQRAGVERLYGVLTRATEDPTSRLVKTHSFHGARDAGSMDGMPVIEFIAASEGRKRDGSILRVDGCDLTNLEVNPRFMYAHQYVDLPIGNILSARKEDHMTLGRVLRMGVAPLRTEGEDDWLKFSRLVFRMYKAHDIDAVSLGWYVVNATMIVDENGYFAGWDFLESDVLELSACSIPVDPNALQAAVARTCESNDERQLLLDGLVAGRTNRFSRDGAAGGRPDAIYVLRDYPWSVEAAQKTSDLYGEDPEPAPAPAPEPAPAPAPAAPAEAPGSPQEARTAEGEGEGATPPATPASDAPPLPTPELVVALAEEVRRLTAEVAAMRDGGVVTRVGKVLSARNRDRLSRAVEACREVADAIEGVIKDAETSTEEAAAAPPEDCDALTARAVEVLGPLADRFERRQQQSRYDAILGGLERTQEVLSRAPHSPDAA
jgi:hypothetical protein